MGGCVGTLPAMHGRLVSLIAAAALAPAAVVAAGCGAADTAEKVAGVDTAQAAQTTAAKGTAKLSMTMKVSGAGLPKPATVTAQGATALTEPKLDLTMDFGEILGVAGMPSVAGGDIRFKIDAGDLYVKPPVIPGFTIPGGKAWVHVDLGTIAKGLGLDPAGLAAASNADPAAQLRTLTAAAGMKKVGTETIDGAETTHFKGTITPQASLKALPADQRQAAEKSLERLEKLPGGKDSLKQAMPVELWIGGDNVVRRMRMEQRVPAEQAGREAGAMTMDYRLSDFGAKVDTSPPPAGDTWEATDTLSKLLGQVATMGGGAGGSGGLLGRG